MASTLSFLVSSQIDVSENLLCSLIGRDELTITESPNDEDVIGSFTLDIQKSKIRDQDCFYVHQVNHCSILVLDFYCFYLVIHSVKFHDFSIAQILREINFGDSTSAKYAILTHLEVLNIAFC